MSNYDAVYSAAINSFRGDYLGAFERVVQEAFSVEWWRVQHEFANAAIAAQEPSVLYRPKVFLDGNHWCALYGENLQDGVAGFGTSPSLAMQAFDTEWHKKIVAIGG